MKTKPKQDILPVILILPSGSCRRGYWDPTTDTLNPVKSGTSDGQNWFDLWLNKDKFKDNEDIDSCGTPEK